MVATNGVDKVESELLLHAHGAKVAPLGKELHGGLANVKLVRVHLLLSMRWKGHFCAGTQEQIED